MKFPLAIVTGSAHRLGKGFALFLARQRYAIILHYNKSKDKAIATEKEIIALGVPVFPIQADLTDPNQAASLFSYVDTLISKPEFEIDCLKVLINCAASMSRADARNTSDEEFNSVINLNLRVPFFCAKMAFQRMHGGGVIVNISDIAGQKTWSAYPTYSISKAGMDSMTRVLARSYAPKVRVNAIAPGLVQAPEDMNSEEWDRLINRLPIQRSATQDELNLVLELLLKNEYITGQTIIVDGGYSLLS